MSAHDQLFGSHVPGRSVVHRLPVGVKYLVVLLGTVPSLLSRTWWVPLVVLACAALLLVMTRLPVRLTLALTPGLLVLLGMIVGYHALVGSVVDGVRIAAALLGCLYLSRMLTMTTPAPVLVDALVRAVSPLRHVGVDPERVGLAVGLMLRSIPYVAGVFLDVRDAARARGIERHPLALLSPAVISTVAYAHRTGDALLARGLGDPAVGDPAVGDPDGGTYAEIVDLGRDTPGGVGRNRDLGD